MRTGRILPAALAIAIAVAAAGCGGSGKSASGTSSTGSATQSAQPPDPHVVLGIPEKVPLVADGPADAGARRVINAWLRALRHGHLIRAAHYFALPSKFQNATPVLTVQTEKQRRAVNRSLPCGAVATGMGGNGAYTIVTFKLVSRPGGNCGTGVGNQARGAIKVLKGHIKEWYRLPDQAPRQAPPADTGPAI
jgi:hypothetical protein